MRTAGLTAVVAATAVAAACSSGTKTKGPGGSGIVTANYVTSNFDDTNDSCGISGGDPGYVDLFVTGNSLVFDSGVDGALPGTISGSTLTAAASTKSYDQDYGFFCTVTTTDSVAGAPNGSAIDVTETYSTTVSGQDCAVEGEAPCTSVLTYTLTKGGATTNPAPNPTPTTLTGTGSATSDSAELSGDYTAPSMPVGQHLQYQMALSGGAGVTGDSNWFCYYDPADLGVNNFGVVETTNFGITMLVSSSAWTVGQHAVDPDHSVYIAMMGTNFEEGIATAGMLTITTAGKTPDASACKFSFSGLTFGADVTPFRAPHSATLRTPRRTRTGAR